MASDDDLASLGEELEGLFGRGVDADLDADAFAGYALRAFGVQFRGNATYRAFCEMRGVTPDNVARWEDVPAVPATAFKHLDLVVGAPADATTVFRTSGTTGGAEVRGRHLVPRPGLYAASALPNLGAHLVPEDEPLAIVSLIPSPEVAPESSLSAMMGMAAARWGDPVRWLAHPGTGVDTRAFLAAAGELADRGRPVFVAGTAFAFVHLLDALTASGRRCLLPEGSRIMETGGFKGRSRAVSRDELYQGLSDRLGVPAGRIVNEYGMTELLSQLYEPVLRRGARATAAGSAGPAANARETSAPRLHVPPPWLRVRALHPTTLKPVAEGEPGLLCFFDLANAGSVSHVLTEDVGVVAPEGLRLQGRAAGAEPRGCGLALEEILAAAEARR